MTVYDWLRINNKRDLQLVNRFAERKFLKFFVTKDN